ncbi:BCCT family transporter [Bacillus massiliigorillae]|uniref:BCCT family transporter n=1 Tax=Bacillus massiliigorillae TaxID=1243664 RepID=UPI0003A79F06|nr:BCCT family transporter [Bacillus massiliigorillae]
MRKESKIDVQILSIAVVLVLLITLPILVNPEKGTAILSAILSFITKDLGSFYLWACIGIFGFLFWLAFSKYGKIRFGKEKPEFSTFSWLALIFTAGIGSGIMYWGIIEWAFYYDSPPFGLTPKSLEAADFAATYGMFHWGFSAWAIYCVPSIPIAYALYIKKYNSVRLSTACRGILGDKADGIIGKIIDVCFMFGLIGGIGTSLALGSPLMAEGLSHWFGIEKTMGLNIAIVIGLTVFVCICLYFGLSKGMKFLSDWNLYLYFGIAIFIFIAGPTVFILSRTTESVGLLFQNFLRMSLYTDSVGGSGFSEKWTIFYWGWWFSYAPFTGMFAARISKGRTIRGLIFGQLIGGTLGCWAAFAIFGNTGMFMQLNNIVPVLDILNSQGAPAASIAILEALPFGSIVAFLYIAVAIIFLVTTVNSGAFTLADVASKNLRDGEEPVRWYRLFWAILLTSIAIVLMYGKALDALQTLTIITALPLVFIMILMIFSFMKWLKEDEHLINSYMVEDTKETDEIELPSNKQIVGK